MFLVLTHVSWVQQQKFVVFGVVGVIAVWTVYCTVLGIVYGILSNLGNIILSGSILIGACAETLAAQRQQL